MTISAWTYTGTTAHQYFIYHGLGCSTWASYYLSIGGNENTNLPSKYAFGFGTTVNAATNNNLASVGNALTNQWVLVTGTYNGSLMSLYINGVLNNTASASGAPWNSRENLYIATDPGCGVRGPLSGKVDDLRIYNRALSAQEVAQLYAQGSVNADHSPSASSGQAPTGLNSGLVGYWTFDGPSVNWATGVVKDLSGQGNNGQVVSMSTSTSPTSGKIGQALKFRAGNSGVNAGTGSSLDIAGGSGTWSAWVYPLNAGDSTAFQEVIFDKESGGVGSGGIFMYLQSNKLCIYNGGAGTCGTGTVSNSKWQLVTIVKNGTTATFYVNGVAGGTASWTGGSQPTIPQVIGYDAQSGGRFFNGSIDDVRIYNRVLSVQEIAQLYSLGR